MAANAVSVRAAAWRVSGKGGRAVATARNVGVLSGVAGQRQKRGLVVLASSKQEREQRVERREVRAGVLAASVAAATAAAAPTEPAFAVAQEMAQVWQE